MYLNRISLLASLLVGSMSVNIPGVSAAPIQTLTVAGFGTFTITYQSFNSSEITNPTSLLAKQPWYKSNTEAFAFATALGGCASNGSSCTAYPDQSAPQTNQLGFPNTFVPITPPNPPDYFDSPLFAFNDPATPTTNTALIRCAGTASGSCTAGQAAVNNNYNGGTRFFAIQYVATPEPLDFLGALTGLAFLGTASRALKKKVG